MKEDQHHAEKESLERELGILKRKNLDLQAVIDAKESVRKVNLVTC